MDGRLRRDGTRVPLIVDQSSVEGYSPDNDYARAGNRRFSTVRSS
jgi:hypothetical protein